MLDAKVFQPFLDSIAHHVVYLNFYFQGEPFLHPKFLDLVKLAVQRIFLLQPEPMHII